MSFSFIGLTRRQVAALSRMLFARLSAAELADLSAGQAVALSGAQLAAIQADAFAGLRANAILALSATQLAGLGAAAVNGLTPEQLDALDVAGLSAHAIGRLTATTLNSFTASQLERLSSAQIRALTAAQVAGLSSATLEAMNALHFGRAEIAMLSANYVGSLSVATFDGAIARHVAYLSLPALAGLSVAQIASMTASQIATLSVLQFDTLNFEQRQAVLAGGPLIAEAKALEVDGALSYSGMLKLLQASALGGMNEIKFGELRLLASELDAPGGVAASDYVAQIARDVIDGNTANAYWNGGGATATSLGDLIASSSQNQMEELIGKWFLGTDHPSLYLPASTGYATPSEYQAVDLPLFGTGGPSYLAVNQGDVGNGYFLAALAETAYTDPSRIENMIHQNPNGTYSVRFQVEDGADWVTVDNQLPIMLDDYQAANGSTLQFANSPFAWSLLIEKAYAQLVQQTEVTPGSVLGVNGNAYADTSGGGGNGVTAITGDATSWCPLGASEPATELAGIASALRDALSAHLDVLFASSSRQSGIGDLVNNQMFEVLQVDVAKASVLLQNPWNGSGVDSGKSMQFWESLSNLAMDGVGKSDPSGFYIARGLTG